MPDRDYSLAIETSCPLGSVTLGRGDKIVATIELPEQRRHTVDLMPTIDRLCTSHGVRPHDIGEVYVSIGPGSFTGLRIGVTTAKILAQVLGTRVIAVPTIEVLAQNVPAPDLAATLAVGVNLKKDSFYCGLFGRIDGRWSPVAPSQLMTMDQLLAAAPRPLLLLGEPLPALPEGEAVRAVTRLPAELVIARSLHVWHLGRLRARSGEFDDPQSLEPLYARRPEAEELWDRKLENAK